MKYFTYSKDVKIPIYVGKLRIILTNKETEIEDGFKIDKYSFGKQASTHDEKGNLMFIVAFYLDKCFTNGIISHECLHVVMDLFNHIGVKYSFDYENGNESFTYFLTWLVNEVYAFMKEKNIKIK